MTISVKINPGLVGGDRTASLDRFATRIHGNPGMSLMGVVELTHVDSVVPAQGDSDKDTVVRMAIGTLEVSGPGSQEDVLRDVARFLYLARTATGTLDGDNEVRIAEQTLQHAVGLVGAEEVARLRAVLVWTQEQLHGIAGGTKLREADIRKAVVKLDERVTAALAGGPQKPDGSW